MLLWAGDKLLLVKTAPTGSGAAYIVAMEKNGSNPQTILTLTTTQQMSNEFIGDETGLYFTIREIDPAPENGEGGLVYAFDESVLLEFLIQHETEPYTKQRYLVNTNDGTITENTLKMPSAGKLIMVIGAYGDYLCVQKDTKAMTWIEHTEDGVPTEVFDLVREYALISKSDYINDVPNYETFEAVQ